MYLKKLEVCGFKSFASRAEFVFEPGVTAIVGPNGCGKSNIADAIKWVLGEQSAKSLRGLKMEDIIFSGTVNKEPVNFAEVSLVLSNHSNILPVDYEEVTIARRLFRSGESEYLLNKTPVRLKDISELLMGTGIGVDNYFLMEQGKIDLVLSSKPEERRLIFEEASGITKYKSKKKEALSKLEQTEANLLRINDIIAEIQRQINSIERQAAKARRHQKHFQRLKELEMNVSGRECQDLEKQQKKIDDEAGGIRDKQAQLASLAESSSSLLKSLRQESGQVDAAMSGIKNESMATENSIFRAQEKIQLNKERIQELGGSVAELTENFNAGAAKTTDLKKQIERLAGEVESFYAEKTSKEGLLDQKQNLLVSLEKSIDEAEEKITCSKSEILEKTAAYTKLKNELAKITVDLAGAQNRLKRLNIEKQNCLTNLNAAKEKAAVAEDELIVQKNNVNALKLQANASNDEFKIMQDKLGLLNNEYDTVGKGYASAQSQVALLEAITAGYEGFSEAVKALLSGSDKDKPWRKGVLGVLADLISVSGEYEDCIEAVLNGDLEAIVVEDAQTAYQAIEYLKENNLGRVKFIALPAQPGENQITGSGEMLSGDGIIGHAADFVKCGQRYIPLLSALLDNTWMVKDLQRAWEISKVKAGARFVTQNADVVSQNCIIAGGPSRGELICLIGRQEKLNSAKRKSESLNEKLQATAAEKDKIVQIVSHLKDELSQTEEKIHQEEIRLAGRQSNNERLAEDFAKLKEELSVVELELDDIAEESGRLSSQDEALKNQISKIEAELNQLEQLINTNHGWAQANLKEKETALVEIAKTKAELESLAQRQSSLQASLNVLIESEAREAASCNAKARQIEGSKAKIIFLQQESQQLLSGLETYKAKRASMQADLNEITNKKKELQAGILEKESDYERLQKDLQEVNSEAHALQAQAAQISFQGQRIKDRISQAYKVDLGEYKLLVQRDADLPEPPVEFDIEPARLEIEELKAKLDSIGPVNLDALGEEKELHGRFNFMVSQRDDLSKAKDSLLEAISKINRTTKEMFLESFGKIQVEFKNFFKLLFGGGDAELFLVDESDVLESGIEIVARPTGKRLQNISLLSGGEKTMTALALLFAVFKVKPSPFCLMDEMDAPLDEANIDRFSRVLHEFTRSSQFIIITHNKRTISIADVMYGITMEESGVSKVVSVKFGDGKEAPIEKAEVAA